jgi:hypothetical protein
MEIDGNLVFQRNGIPFNQGDYNEEEIVPVPFDIVDAQPFPNAPFELTITALMTGANDGYRSNDTIQLTHSFDNQYAYDDGSAERVYGLSNVGGATTAIAFSPLKADTLKGIYTLFGQAQVDATLNSFRIGLWEDLGGLPGNLIYLSDSVYTPVFYETDNLIAYALDTSGIYIDRSVYIGLQQTTVNPLNIGLDVNQDDTDTSTYIVYNDGVSWFQSLFTGRLLLRPYFSYQPSDLGWVEGSIANEKPLVYPNPAKDRIVVQWSSEETIAYSLMDMQGRSLKEGKCDTGHCVLDLQGLKSGLYILRWRVAGQRGHERSLIE